MSRVQDQVSMDMEVHVTCECGKKLQSTSFINVMANGTIRIDVDTDRCDKCAAEAKNEEL